jgi:hypothetical protein
MDGSDEVILKKSVTPVVLGIICFIIYLAFIASSFYWTGGWINSLFQDHYVFFVGLPFSGFLAYFIVGTLENVRGNIEFEAFGIKFKGASGPIIMWVIVYMSIVLSIKMVWPLSPT